MRFGILDERSYSQPDKLSAYRLDEEEQKRIANFHRSLDDLITAATQKLETLKTHKKALMQQLFPSAKAVES
jgi:type I restriction enzyme S subunit